MDASERRALADGNVTAALRLAAERLADERGGSACFGEVDAIATGVDVAFFNPVLALDPACTPADVLAGLAWIESRGLPASIHVRDDVDTTVRPALEANGLVAEDWQAPVMALEPIPSAPAPPADAHIRSGGIELSDDLHHALESGDILRRIFGPALLGDPAVRLAVGYLDDEPVSAAVAIRWGASLGIYGVGTLEGARRRGFGRATTWAAIEAGAAAWGSTIVFLQSSELGLPVYRSMGFEDVGRYVQYRRPRV
jgi:ribosomal protein S18 acetylase RimI-like enzyme